MSLLIFSSPPPPKENQLFSNTNFEEKCNIHQRGAWGSRVYACGLIPNCFWV